MLLAAQYSYSNNNINVASHFKPDRDEKKCEVKLAALFDERVIYDGGYIVDKGLKNENI